VSDLVNGHYKLRNADWLRAGSPAVFAESIPKLLAGGDLAIAATGVELAFDIQLDAGDVVTSLTFVTGGTAAGTPTAGYAVLRDSAGAKLAQTADFGSTARAANTAYTVALSAPYVVSGSGLFKVGISFTATTVPTLRGISLGNAAVAAVGRACTQTHGSSVGATAPATIASPTSASVIPYILVS
jgi:hypothetical protein